MNIRRYLQAGAIWGWPQIGDPLTDARARYVVTGAPRVVESPWGLALSLDGANDYVTLKDSEEHLLRFDSGAQDFSLVAWVRQTDPSGVQLIIDKRDADNDGWRLQVFDNLIYASINTIDITSAAGVLNDQLWHCVILVIDRSGNGQIYVDGLASGGAVAISGEVMATATIPRIGLSAYTVASYFNGGIAGIVIFDRVLTPAECLALATPGRAF